MSRDRIGTSPVPPGVCAHDQGLPRFAWCADGALFLFRSPRTLLHVVQAQVLSLCAHAALCLMVYLQLPDNWPLLPLLLLPLVIGPISLLRTLERLTLIFSVGTLAERSRVLAAIRAG